MGQRQPPKVSLEDIQNINEWLKKLDAKLDRIEKRLDTSVAEIRQAFKAEITEVKKEVESIARHTESIEKSYDDMIETTSRLCNLRVDGIPHTEREDLNSIVNNLKAAVGVKPEETRTKQFRLKSGKSKNTIIVQFINQLQKDDFFQNFIKVAKKLTVGNVIKSHNSNKERIYVSHDLCLTQYHLLRRANKLRLEKKLSEVRVNNGFVMVKMSTDGRFQRVLSSQMLDHLSSAAHDSSSTSTQSNQNDSY